MLKENVIEVKNVTKNFNGTKALSDVSFDVKKNEVACIIGQNGAGKTTLLRTIAGVEKPDSGFVKVDGTMGMVFQHCYLWPHMKVLDNITLPLVKVKKMDKKSAEEKAKNLLAQLGAEHLIDSFPEALSGGEMQRIAIARSLIMEPDSLLFDEITAALDPILTKDMLEILRKLTKQRKTMLIVTHHINFAKNIADRIILLDHGKIIEDAHPYKFFSGHGIGNDLTRKIVQSSGW